MSLRGCIGKRVGGGRGGWEGGGWCGFFFFKQKTAYEMCGRDWSSDVCSSDLPLLILIRLLTWGRLVKERSRQSVTCGPRLPAALC